MINVIGTGFAKFYSRDVFRHQDRHIADGQSSTLERRFPEAALGLQQSSRDGHSQRWPLSIHLITRTTHTIDDTHKAFTAFPHISPQQFPQGHGISWHLLAFVKGTLTLFRGLHVRVDREGGHFVFQHLGFVQHSLHRSIVTGWDIGSWCLGECRIRS